VSAELGPLGPALHSAVEALQGRRLRFEVFARAGETDLVRRTGAGEWERRRSREVGVAVRLAGDGAAGFAAAAGSGARAGHEAATAALEAMVPARDPLPPRELLGVTVVAPPPPRLAADRREALAQALAAAVNANGRVDLVELRLLDGRAQSALLTGEGFTSAAETGAASIELLLAPPAGPWRLLRTALADLRHVEVEALAERAVEAALLYAEGDAPRHQLADVVLSPAAAAPLVAALARHLSARDLPDAGERRPRVSALWHLLDERAGPEGLLPLPCDGEGFPARAIALLAGGHARERFASWDDLAEGEGRAGGAVRGSYREPPVAGPANLVVRAGRPVPQTELLAALAPGFWVDHPAGEVRLDPGSDRFALRAAAVSVAAGRAVAAHPSVELRGSFRRLLSGLAGVGADPASVALDCVVTTPSLLVRRLEIA
jgi:predicted Zn-dependent protease